MPTLVLGENPTLTPGTTAAPVPAPGTTPPTTAPATTPTIPNEPDTGNPDTFAPTAAIGPAPTVDPFATRPPTLPIPEESGETPSLSPSSSPSDIVLGTATPTAEVVQAEINEMWVVSDPITVEASGATDLQEYKQEFFDVTMKAMQQYLSAYLGEVLLQFNLKLTFLESDTEVTPVGITSGNALVKSYFIISVEYKIGSESMDVLIEFTNNWADKLVEDFFRGTAKVRLIADLEAEEMFLSGFRVIKISVNDGGGDPPNDQGEDEGDFGNIPGDADSGGNDPVDESTKSPTRTPTDAPSTTPEQLSDVEDTPTPTTTSTSNTALYAGIVSAGVVFIALIAVVYSSRRRKRLWFNDAVDSVADSLYSDGLGPPDGKVLPVLTPRGVSMATTHTTRTSLSSGSTPTRSRVKPAAIQLRGQNGKSHGSVSTLGSLNMPLRPVLERRDNEDNESTDTEEKHDDDLMRMEDGPDLLATNTLTSLDNSYSFDRMAETYPEFELYSGVPSTWSVDGLTLEDDEEAERIEQARHRRRWQDEYTDLELRGLPEHESSEGSRRARGSAYSASSGYSGSSHGSAGYRRRVD